MTSMISSLVWSFRISSTSAASTYLFTLSLHDALPILRLISGAGWQSFPAQQIWTSLFPGARRATGSTHRRDRKSTRLNSSHVAISYAVFCLKKKNLYMQQGDAFRVQAHVRVLYALVQL